jgi:hypothetical protein
LGDEITTLFADYPDAVGLAVTAFVRLSPSPIPRVDIFGVLIDLGFCRFQRSSPGSMIPTYCLDQLFG